jgi:thymidine phosphorylase
VIFEAGIDLHAKPGDRVVAGQPLFTLSAADEARFPRALEALEGSWAIGDAATGSATGFERGPIVRERITA